MCRAKHGEPRVGVWHSGDRGSKRAVGGAAQAASRARCGGGGRSRRVPPIRSASGGAKPRMRRAGREARQRVWWKGRQRERERRRRVSAGTRCATPGAAKKRSRSLAEAGDRLVAVYEEALHQASARQTGIPSCRALSTRLPVTPPPGKAMTPLGSSSSSASFAPERGCAFVRLPVRANDHLVHAAGLGPLRRHRLDAGGAAVDEDHVAVLRVRPVEDAPDGGGVRDLLAAGHRHQGALGQVRAGLALLAGAPGSRARRWQPT